MVSRVSDCRSSEKQAQISDQIGAPWRRQGNVPCKSRQTGRITKITDTHQEGRLGDVPLVRREQQDVGAGRVHLVTLARVDGLLLHRLDVERVELLVKDCPGEEMFIMRREKEYT